MLNFVDSDLESLVFSFRVPDYSFEIPCPWPNSALAGALAEMAEELMNMLEIKVNKM